MLVQEMQVKKKNGSRKCKYKRKKASINNESENGKC